jgi:hypothetical protein
MEEYSSIKEKTDGKQVPERNKEAGCGKKESKETLATDKNTY